MEPSKPVEPIEPVSTFIDDDLLVWKIKSPEWGFFILPVFRKTEEIIAGSGLISGRRC